MPDTTRAANPADPSPDDFESEFEADFEGEFEVEGFYPYATVQQWAALNPDIDERALSVLTFIMCHLNPSTGKFDAHFGRQRIAERFGRSLDWVDDRVKTLVKAGALSKRHMYWTDGTKTARTPVQVDPETGAKRSPAPNQWRVRMVPPGGDAFPHAVKIAEYYSPKLIARRLNSRGVAAEERLGHDQAKRDESPAQGVAAVQRPGVAAVQRPGVAAVQRPERTRKGKTTKKNIRQAGSDVRASDPAAPAELPACLPDESTKQTRSTTPAGPGAELLARLPRHLATPQVIRQHSARMDALLAAGWAADALYRRLATECDGTTGPGRLVTAIRDVPDSPPARPVIARIDDKQRRDEIEAAKAAKASDESRAAAMAIVRESLTRKRSQSPVDGSNSATGTSTLAG